MSRFVVEVRLQDKTARARLKPKPEPYWRMIGEGRHLGYYKGTKRSSWVARIRSGDGYAKEKLGGVDDVHDADGIEILSWDHAVERASNWFAARKSAGAIEVMPMVATPVARVPTVREALESYIEMRDARERARAGREIRSDAHRMKRNVLNDGALADTFLCDLAESQLRTWRTGLKFKSAGRQRITNDFRASLNDAFMQYREVLPADFPNRIRFGLRPPKSEIEETEPVARDNQILTDDQVRSIVKAAFKVDADGDLGRMIFLLAATGARFSQLRRMCVRDVQADQSRVLVPSSRKGKRKAAFFARVQVGDDLLKALGSAVEGRPSDAPLLERWRYIQRTPTNWERERRGPWLSAAELTRPWRRVLAEAGLEHVIPYALRHSSIVRGIRLGLPIRLVAALHDTSVVMIERHYARWITEGLDELAARAVVPLLDTA